MQVKVVCRCCAKCSQGGHAQGVALCSGSGRGQHASSTPPLLLLPRSRTKSAPNWAHVAQPCPSQPHHRPSTPCASKALVVTGVAAFLGRLPSQRLPGKALFHVLQPGGNTRCRVKTPQQVVPGWKTVCAGRAIVRGQPLVHILCEQRLGCGLRGVHGVLLCPGRCVTDD